MLNLSAIGEPDSTELALVELSRRVPAIDAKLR